MKIFKSIQKCLAMEGVHRPQAYQMNEQEFINFLSFFNVKNILILVSLFVNFFSVVMFLVHEANTFGEYCECFYSLMTCTAISLSCFEFILKTPRFFEMITNFENTIWKRKTYILRFFSWFFRKIISFPLEFYFKFELIMIKFSN